MSDDVQQYRPMTVMDLVRQIQRFQSDCDRSGDDVGVRWLAAALQPALDVACEVGNCRIGPETRASINAFRANEIEKELERKRRDIDALERELKKARAA